MASLDRAVQILQDNIEQYGYLSTVKRQASTENDFGESVYSDEYTTIYTNLPIVSEYKQRVRVQTEEGLRVFEDVLKFTTCFETTSGTEVSLLEGDIITYDGIDHTILNVQYNSYAGWIGILSN